MRVVINGRDLREYGGKLLTVKTAPPKMATNYEMITRALLPTEYETDIPLGSLTITIYFPEKNRAALERKLSSFMRLFRGSCVIEKIKNYKGSYKGFLTDDSYQETLKKEKKILSLTFDGYFFDENRTFTIDGKKTGRIEAEGSRDAPCLVEIKAKTALKNFTVTINDETFTVESLAAGKTILIDGRDGTATIDGENAFRNVDLWEFPKLEPGKNELTFSSDQATVKVTYRAMWL